MKREEEDRRKDAERLAALKAEEEKILKAKSDYEAAAKLAKTEQEKKALAAMKARSDTETELKFNFGMQPNSMTVRNVELQAQKAASTWSKKPGR